MPVKNTGAFLEECLDSILNQTFKDWELIAVDDTSTDHSHQILQSYSNKDVRVKIFKNSGNGIIAALQLAYLYSKGCFITRMDSDDLMEPEKLELMLNRLQLKRNGHIAVGLVNYFASGVLGEGYSNYANWLNKLTLSESNFSAIYIECTIPSPCWMISRNEFDNCGGFNSDVYPEDYDLAFRFRKAGLKITAVKKVIHQWRDYDTRTSRTDKNYADNRFAELKVMHFLEQDYDTEKSLVLWGAGKKGKKVAQLLSDRKISFQWVSNNIKKVGHNIYGIILEDMSAFNQLENAQVIIAISSPDDSEEINQVISKNQQNEYYRFYG